MAKAQTQYVCQSCGSVAPRWTGRCNDCGGWNTLTSETVESFYGKPAKSGKAPKLELVALDGVVDHTPRQSTGSAELDRVLGGGLVEGAATLIGGDPGIGKSTLLLQAACLLSARGMVCHYVSGEESINQIKLRAARLGLSHAGVMLAASTSVREVLGLVNTPNPPQLLVVDSIQTMHLDTIDAAPGTVTQVRACTHELIQACKKKGVAVIIVGHVTKEGQIAGPRVLEHMVDTVLYFEGERGHSFRILRAVKNRFGGTDEIGVFEMSDKGLTEVTNPSALFLGNRNQDVSGSAVLAGMEGTRPLLVEIQALVAPSQLATPRRAVVGWDQARLAMVLAVLEARYGIRLSQFEVYLSIAGGFKVNEPAADLAVTAALLSALADKPAPKGAIFFGELGLSGELRPVARTETRIKEAEKLGFTTAYLPEGSVTGTSGMTIRPLNNLFTLADYFELENKPRGYR